MNIKTIIKKRFLKYFSHDVQNDLNQKGWIIEHATTKEKVLNLIKSVHPVETERKLIRVGPNHDGGYLLPNDLDGIEACFSPGVGQLSGFERDCAAKGMKLFLADKSVEKPKEEGVKINFISKFIGATINKDFITLDKWVSQSDVSEDQDLLLQMDIEGHEFNSIINISPQLLNRCRILVIEFHGLERLWNREFYPFAKEVFDKILQNHTCVHIHPNNHCAVFEREGIEIPAVAEFTFLRNDRFESKTKGLNFPHKLDFDCDSTDPTLVLPKVWYS